MAASIKFPVLRQTLIVLAFIALVGLFFALNLLIFIPRQQQAYHDKIFRVLKEVVRDFENSLQGKADFIARNKYKKERDTSVYLQDCNYDSLKRNLLYAFDTLQNTYVKSDYFFDYSFIPDSAKLNLEENNKDTSVQISLHEVLKPSIDA